MSIPIPPCYLSQGPAPQHHQFPLHERPSHVSLSPVRHRRRTPRALGSARCVGMGASHTSPPTGWAVRDWCSSV